MISSVVRQAIRKGEWNLLGVDSSNNKSFRCLGLRPGCFVYKSQFPSVNSHPKAEEKPKSKKPPVEYITLIDLDQNSTFATLPEVTKLATRRGLKLIKVKDFDPKRQTPVYRMMASSEYLKEDIYSKKSRTKDSEFKSTKIVSIASKISDHDLASKIRNIKQWIGKKYEVRVSISGSESNDKVAEEVYNKMELSLKDIGRILQKRNSGTDIKFQVVQPKQNTSKQNNQENCG